MSYTSEVLADSPVLYWRFGESAGPTAEDATANNRDGTYAGCTFSQAGAIAGDADTGVLLDGIDDRITRGDEAALDLGDVFTMECWLKRTAGGLTLQMHVFNKGPNAYNIQFKGAGSNTFSLAKEDVAYIVESTASITDTTTFHHIVATKNGATSALYLDGADVTGTVTNQTCSDSTESLYIGSKYGAYAFGLFGVLDEVALYSTALSPARVLVHYNAGLGVFPSVPSLFVVQSGSRLA